MRTCVSCTSRIYLSIEDLLQTILYIKFSQIEFPRFAYFRLLLSHSNMELFSLSIILSFFLISISFYIYSLIIQPNTKGFKNYPLIGTLPDFIKSRHCHLTWTTKVIANCPTNTSTMHFPRGFHFVVTANPPNVEHILKTNFENYPKGHVFTFYFTDFLGRGIFNSDGEQWKIQRKPAISEFSSKSLHSYVIKNIVSEIQTKLVPLLANASETTQVLDFQDVLERFAFDNICKIAFNADLNCLTGKEITGHEIMRAFDDATALCFGRFMYASSILWKLKRFLNVGSERKLRDSIKMIRDFAENIVRSRIEAVENGCMQELEYQDLLSRFIQKHEKSPEFLRDIVISFTFAGKDTTSSALTWFFWLLSSRKDIEQNILKELEKIRVKHGKMIGNLNYNNEQLREMHYLHAALSEAMRLYPPVPVDSRTCWEDDILPDGTFVRKNWIVTYHTYAMGRMEGIWGKNCEEYSPERWLENGVFRQESPFRFPVFHAGPRLCLGKEMAFAQMKLIAASVIERFEIEVCDENKCPEYELSLTLRMKNGLCVRVKDRCS